MIEIENLTKRYSGSGVPAIQSVDLSVSDGEILGFVGLNGAGKTTTIRTAVGVTLPTSGRVRIDGSDIREAKEKASQSVGWVPEFPNFEPQARALNHLVYLAGFHKIPPGVARERSRSLLARVGLQGRERARIRTFSQGMKKRYAIAAAMLAEPRNYLLDEALNGLDPEGIHLVREWLMECKRDQRAVLLSSHILSEVQMVADRIAIIHHGRILTTLTREQLSERHGTSLRLEIENLDESGLNYLGSLGELSVETPTTVRITGASLSASEINRVLVGRGYRVARLIPEEPDLESAFFELTRGAG